MSRRRTSSSSTPESRTRVPASPSDAGASPRASIFPAWKELLEPAGPFLVPLLTLVLTRIAFAIMLPLASEDAYITFRYARAFSQGHGLSFNPGEHVMGFTSAPWTLWNAIPLRTPLAPEVWSRGTLLVADVLTLLVGGRMLLATFGRLSAWAFTFFFAAWPYFAAQAASGMENGAMLCLIVVGAALARAGSPVAGPIIGLLALWRPEGVIAAALLALGARGRDRLVALAIAAAGYGALAWSFGTPIAQSAIAKAQLYGTPGPWAGRIWWEWLLPGPLGRWSQVAETSNLLGLLMILSPAIALGIPALWQVRSRPIALAALGALAVWFGYALTGAPWFFWYFVVPLGGFALVAAAGLPRIVKGRAIPIAAALYVLGSWTVARYLYVGRAQNEFYLFAAAADVLSRNARPGEAVMLEPIGIIGWRAPLRVIDEVGLVSPDVLKRRLQGPGWYTDILARRNPEWLVVRRGVVSSGEAFAGAGRPFRNSAERDSTFARYALVQELDPRSGDNALQVRRRIR